MNCNYQFVECSNEGCDEVILRRHLDDHLRNKCPERMYNCPSLALVAALNVGC